jgi:ABC-2 type transport system ATP-binding protein
MQNASATLPPEQIEPAISVHNLSKQYGSHQAVRGISFAVAHGEVFGLLGPNGAGKTTTVEILEGYRQPTSGSVRVLGYDPATRPQKLRAQLGIVLQSCGIYPHITVREALTQWANYYSKPRPVEATLALVGLAEVGDRRTKTLSGGQLRRLDFALALIGDPQLIFLDEPTTGFDPQARHQTWQTIKKLRQLGKTVVLTTHYLEEAQLLADRVAIIRQGQIVALGAPEELGAQRDYCISYRTNGERITQFTADPTKFLHQLTQQAITHGEQLEELSVARPNLEDVYLELTQESNK